MMNRQAVLDAISAERDRQDEKWGTSFPHRPDAFWLTILAEEFGEIANAILEELDDEEIENEILQTAAVCVSWLQYRVPSAEQLDVRLGDGDEG